MYVISGSRALLWRRWQPIMMDLAVGFVGIPFAGFVSLVTGPFKVRIRVHGFKFVNSLNGDALVQLTAPNCLPSCATQLVSIPATSEMCEFCEAMRATREMCFEGRATRGWRALHPLVLVP